MDTKLYFNPATGRMVTRQRMAQIKAAESGRCTGCYGPRDNDLYRRCISCHTKNLIRQRARCGHQPWKPGGLGRPPRAMKPVCSAPSPVTTGAASSRPSVSNPT